MVGAVEAGAGEAGHAHAACPPFGCRARRAWRTGSAGPASPIRSTGHQIAVGIALRRFGAEQPHGQREMGEDMVDRAGFAPRRASAGAPFAVGRQSRACRRAGPWPAGAPAAPRRHARASRRRPRGAAAAPWRALTG